MRGASIEGLTPMTFPVSLDPDKVITAALSAMDRAIDGWLEGGLTTEEPLMSRLIEQITQRHRRCDVGRVDPVTMHGQVALLHRRGKQQRDLHGSDLALTIDVPAEGFRKTALFQLKVCEEYDLRLEKQQLLDTRVDPRVAERAFVLAVDRTHKVSRFDTTKNQIESLGQAASIGVDCSKWDGLAQWLPKWLACQVGAPSDTKALDSIEKALQPLVVRVEAPRGKVIPVPWAGEPSRGLPDNFVTPAAWLQLIFRQSDRQRRQR